MTPGKMEIERQLDVETADKHQRRGMRSPFIRRVILNQALAG
jgi:hypothetical protein